MTDFQKERLEYVLKKENEISQKEQKLATLAECNENMNKYKNIIGKLSTDLTRTFDDFNQIVKFINQTSKNMNNNSSGINNSSSTNANMNSIYSSLSNSLPNLNSNNTVILAGNEGLPSAEKNLENFENLDELNEINELDNPIE
jgi:cobalamin biosynthesis Co2+ chelatase CbiK